MLFDTLDNDDPGGRRAAARVGRAVPGSEEPASATAGPRTEGSLDNARFETLRRALIESQAQCRTARCQIDTLGRRIAELEKEHVALVDSVQHARHLAYHDALTGLANRTLLEDRFEQAVSRAQRSRGLVAVLLIDLNGFKRVNDRLGHAAGDHLLQSVAARLSASIRTADTACRHGGDEFVIMLPDLDSAAMADAVVAKVRTHLGVPHAVDGHRIRITASVGGALYPYHGGSYEQLMKHADAAMYLAKAASCPGAEILSTQVADQMRRPACRASRHREQWSEGEASLDGAPEELFATPAQAT